MAKKLKKSYKEKENGPKKEYFFPFRASVYYLIYRILENYCLVARFCHRAVLSCLCLGQALSPGDALISKNTVFNFISNLPSSMKDHWALPSVSCQ